MVILGRKYNYANDKERRELLIIGALMVILDCKYNCILSREHVLIRPLSSTRSDLSRSYSIVSSEPDNSAVARAGLYTDSILVQISYQVGTIPTIPGRRSGCTSSMYGRRFWISDGCGS